MIFTLKQKRDACKIHLHKEIKATFIKITEPLEQQL